MKTKIFLNAIAAVTILLFNQDVTAKDYQIGDLKISEPWARSSPSRAKTGAAYVTKISNHGSKIDRLIDASAPVAKRVEVHTNIIENGIAKMRHVKAIDINPGHSITLKPGGYHIMLMGLKAPLKIGDIFPLTLTFEKAGEIKVMTEIRKIGGSHSHKMSPGKMSPGKMKH